MIKKNKITISVFIILIALAIIASAEKDSDLDGIPDSRDKYIFDYDNDGMPDICEKKNGLRYYINDAKGDIDGDGIININEYKQGTSPLEPNDGSSLPATKPTQEINLTVAENVLLKILIWTGTILIAIAIILFILFKTHISNIFDFMHHVGKGHFNKHLPHKNMPRRIGISSMQVASHSPHNIRPTINNIPNRYPNTKRRYTKTSKTYVRKKQKKSTPDVYIPLEKLKQNNQTNVFERLKKDIHTEKNKDVFKELSKDIQDHKGLKKLDAFLDRLETIRDK